MPNSKVPNESKKIFSKNLKHYIDKSGKERATIANELGVAYTTFSSWCSGVNYPRIDKIDKMAKYFGIKSSDLIDEHQNSETDNQQVKEHVDLKKDPTVLSYGGKPVSKEDMEIIKAILERHFNDK